MRLSVNKGLNISHFLTKHDHVTSGDLKYSALVIWTIIITLHGAFFCQFWIWQLHLHPFPQKKLMTHEG